MNKSSAGDNVIRCLIVDDHPVVREGIAAMIDLQEELCVISKAQDGMEAVEQFRQHRPDITLMDLNMPKMTGVEAIIAIREEFPDARIIILTTFDGEEDIYRGLRAGARAYLLKDASIDLLLDTIHQVNRGKTLIPPEVAAKLAVRMSSTELTARELEVLKLIVQGNSNHEIAEALFITEGTVKAHVNSILNKLDVSDRTQAVTTALKWGIVRLE